MPSLNIRANGNYCRQIIFIYTLLFNVSLNGK